MKVLVVEDSPEVAEAITLCLQTRWPDTTLHTTGSGAEALRIRSLMAPDLVILDLGLPDIDGLEVLGGIRASSNVPVIIVTGRTSVTARVKGLEMGADDYVVKPFSHTELLARVNAVLRRGSRAPEDPGKDPQIIKGPGLTIDLPRCQVLVAGEEVHLTPTEWHMLELLAANAGKVISHESLAKLVWGTEHIDPATIKMVVHRLRGKLSPNGEGTKLIRSHRGLGYSFSSTPGEADADVAED